MVVFEGLLQNLWGAGRKPAVTAKAKRTPVHRGIVAGEAADAQFIGPQEGPGAAIFENLFLEALVALPQVHRAYFCKLRFPEEEVNRAAVCVVTASARDPAVVDALIPVVRRHLDQKYQIDILTLSEPQENELKKVCRPFYWKVGCR